MNVETKVVRRRHSVEIDVTIDGIYAGSISVASSRYAEDAKYLDALAEGRLSLTDYEKTCQKDESFTT